jgi:hypothetical protein
VSSRALSKHTRINQRKDNFINSPKLKQGVDHSGIEKKCKFNFDYFDDTQHAGQSFRDWQDECETFKAFMLQIELSWMEAQYIYPKPRLYALACLVLYRAIFDLLERKILFT